MRLAQIGIIGRRNSVAIPDKEDAMFWLDGTIEEIEGTYYFKDRSGNDRHFPIDNPDFPAGWSKGFPYKSKATISAPPGDTDLIAADVNNFLYDSNGDPNEIPVVSLFQNIDYANTLYTRHTARQINGLGQETIQPRVLDIVLYNSPRSDDYYKAYFGVPEEVTSNVKWVSPSGDDSSGDGSRANPWKTLNKANTSATAGDTVYVMSGVYEENHTGTTGYWLINKSLNYVGLGRVYVSSANTGYVAFINGLVSLSLEGLVIGNDVVTGSAVVGMGSFASTLVFDRCLLRNGFAGVAAISAADLTIRDCIYTGITNRNNSIGNTNLTLTGCYYDNRQAYISSANTFKTIVMTYNRLTTGRVTNTASVAMIYSHNVIAGDLDVDGTEAGITAATSQLRIEGNTVNGAGIFVRTNYYDCTISENNLTATSGSGSIISVQEQTSLLIKRNRLKNTGGKSSYILAGASTDLAKHYVIEDNLIESDGDQAPIVIGNESNLGYNSVSGIIRNNNCIGTGNSSSAHGIAVFNQTGVKIRYCRVQGYAFGAIVKVEGSDLSDADISYCLFINCGNGISAKGGLNQVIANNTVINAINGVSIVQNESGDHTLGTVLKNNIFYDDSEANSSYRAVSYQSGSTLTSDNNVFYSVNNANQFFAGANITTDQWLALGYDANSLFTNPNLNSDYLPSSPITIGENLGEDYIAGLDVSTNWGNENTLPSIVTREQVAEGPWEVGAYVQR